MAGILLRVLLVPVCLIGVLLLFGLIALCVRAGVEAVGVNGQVSAVLRYGIVRIPVWPLPEKKRGKKTEKSGPPQKHPPKVKKQPKYRRVFNREALDIGELLDLALRLLDELTGTLRIGNLRVRVLIGTDDAAKTGILLGQSAALTGMLVPFFENTFEMKDYHIDIDADFDADHTEWAFTVFCSLRPIRLVLLLLRHGGELLRLYKRLIKKEEAITNE